MVSGVVCLGLGRIGKNCGTTEEEGDQVAPREASEKKALGIGSSHATDDG